MNEKKTVTFLISSLEGGGAEGVCVNIANGFVTKGWQVDLVVLNLNNAAYLDRVSNNINIVVLGANHARYAFLPLRNYLINTKPKRILVFNYELAVLLVILRSLFKYRFKLIARNINTISRDLSSVSGFWHKQISKRLIRSLYSRVDHVINQCKAMEEDLLNVFPSLIGKTSVIYNPVSQVIEDAGKTINFSKVVKEDYLLCVGRLESQKAFHYAIEAFASIAKKNQSLRLKIVGQGSLEANLKQLSSDLDIADRVDFEGFQKNMIPYYLKARATLLTSLYEGFPNVLVESITLATPIVSFDCQSGPSEIIDDNVNGYLVRYQDIDDFKCQLKKLLSTKFDFESIKKTADFYTVSSIVEKYELRVNSYTI